MALGFCPDFQNLIVCYVWCLEAGMFPVLVHAYNPNTSEAEAEGLPQVSQGYLTRLFQNKNNRHFSPYLPVGRQEWKLYVIIRINANRMT